MTTSEPNPPVLPQWHAGVHFRSSLEARWAILFDRAGIDWDYEPEGFVIGGRPYRPDFLLNCGTWVEVKGDPARLDLDLMVRASIELPRVEPKIERGPRLLLLGSLPAPKDAYGDWGWIGLQSEGDTGDEEVIAGYYGFGNYRKNVRPWWLDWADPVATGIMFSIGKAAEYALTPQWFDTEQGCPEAYAAARAHRFGR